MTEPVLVVERLSRHFGALRATDEVSLDLRPGEVHALIGPNGAGKSTLIGQIAGWQPCDTGRVLLAGEDVTRLSVAARARRGLGRSFQVSSLAPSLSVRRNVMLAVQGASGVSYRFWRPAARDRALTEAAGRHVAWAGLDDRAGDPVGVLSHGERRQLEMACALALEPRALLLDEPMAGLGMGGTAKLTELLLALKSRVPILLVEHDMDVVFRLADRITVLVYGRVIATGAPEAIRSDPDVREAYLGDAA